MNLPALIVLSITAVAALGCATRAEEPQATKEGLVAVHSGNLDEFYVRPDANLSAYGKVFIDPVAVGLYSFGMAWIIGKIIDKTMGFRLAEEDEAIGIDVTVHAETAYDLAHLGGGGATRAPNIIETAETKVETDA